MISRRQFLVTGSAAAMLGPSLAAKTRIAIVGTGIRGVNMWGKNVQENYSDVVEFVGLSDINPGRLAFAKRHIGASCPTFVDFDEMLRTGFKRATPVRLIRLTRATASLSTARKAASKRGSTSASLGGARATTSYA